MKNPADTVYRGSSYKSWDNGLWTQTLTVKERNGFVLVYQKIYIEYKCEDILQTSKRSRLTLKVKYKTEQMVL